MKKAYPLSLVQNPLTVLRKAGYSPFRDPQTGDESFIVRLTADFYPRFHLYVEQTKTGFSFNLHLDQKKPSYGENHAHSGEYEGSTIEKEMARIDGWVLATLREAEKTVCDTSVDPQVAPAKKSWFSKLFG